MSRQIGVIVVALVVGLVGSGYGGTYSGGTGTPEDPYKIGTVEDWEELIGASGDWDKCFVLMNDIDFGGINLTPMAPDVNSGNWVFDGIAFIGVFDGNGHVVRNGVIDLPGSDRVGLFGYIGAGGQVKNMGVENINITGRKFVGGLVGWNWGGTITACFWDVETSWQPLSSGGKGKITAEMKIRSTFTDASWDFVGESSNGTADIWRMCTNGVDYPRLSWEFSQNGDFDCPDGVALDDLLYLASRWLGTTPETVGSADPTADGKVDFIDLSIMAEQWLKEE